MKDSIEKRAAVFRETGLPHRAHVLREGIDQRHRRRAEDIQSVQGAYHMNRDGSSRLHGNGGFRLLKPYQN